MLRRCWSCMSWLESRRDETTLISEQRWNAGMVLYVLLPFSFELFYLKFDRSKNYLRFVYFL